MLKTAGSSLVHVLSETDRNVLAAIAAELTENAGRLDDRWWLDAVRAAWQDAPAGLRKRLAAVLRHSGDDGALLVRGVPVPEAGSIPATPSHSGAAQTSVSATAALLLLVVSGLGEPVAYRPEKSGRLVQDVVPVPGNEDFQGNEGSVLLSFHNENAFHPHRPDHVLLMCLRPDHDGLAGLRLACVRRALPLLGPATVDALFRDEYVTAAPPSFGQDAEAAPGPVLSGDRADPDVVVDFAATRPLTSAAGDALLALQESLAGTARTVRLEHGDLAIVDNRVTLHGRTAFRPRYDGRDRWLQRAFSVRDLRRSRDHRPRDGHVLCR